MLVGGIFILLIDFKSEEIRDLFVVVREFLLL